MVPVPVMNDYTLTQVGQQDKKRMHAHIPGCYHNMGESVNTFSIKDVTSWGIWSMYACLPLYIGSAGIVRVPAMKQ